MAKEIRKCLNKECRTEFTCYPSNKKQYCCNSCASKETVLKRLTFETKQKISETLKKHIRTLEHGKNISKSLKTSTKAQKLQFKKGKENPAYGKGDLQKGSLNPNWKGGRTNLNQKLRNAPQYRIWRNTCMERDCFKCTNCGAKGYLHVHHIKEISTHPELIWVVENGKTVCVPCHEKIHGRFIGKFKQKQ